VVTGKHLFNLHGIGTSKTMLLPLGLILAKQGFIDHTSVTPVKRSHALATQNIV